MDIKEIFEEAKQALLKDGEHRPMLWTETDQGKAQLIVFADFPFETTLDKQKALFATGRKAGKEYPGESLKSAVFITETWMSQQKPGEPRKYRFPKDDPQRKEALIALALTVTPLKSLKHSMYIAEMIRNKAEDLIDLLPYDEISAPESNLLVSFLAGFESAKLSDEEFSEIVARTASDGGKRRKR